MDPIHESPRSYWVVEGTLAAGAHPITNPNLRISPNLDELLAAGFDSFIDLTQPGERDTGQYQRHLAGLDQEAGPAARYRRFAIPDMSVPSVEQMADVLDYLEQEMRDGRRVFLHCQAGLGRTGTVIGCYLSRAGVASSEVLKNLSALRRLSGALGSSPETEGQRRFVQAWGQIDPARAQNQNSLDS